MVVPFGIFSIYECWFWPMTPDPFPIHRRACNPLRPASRRRARSSSAWLRSSVEQTASSWDWKCTIPFLGAYMCRWLACWMQPVLLHWSAAWLGMGYVKRTLSMPRERKRESGMCDQNVLAQNLLHVDIEQQVHIDTCMCIYIYDTWWVLCVQKLQVVVQQKIRFKQNPFIK